jgi:hypothetical protein
MKVKKRGIMKRWHNARYFCNPHKFDDKVRVRMSGGREEQCLVCVRCGQTVPYHPPRPSRIRRAVDSLAGFFRRNREEATPLSPPLSPDSSKSEESPS